MGFKKKIVSTLVISDTNICYFQIVVTDLNRFTTDSIVC